MLIDHIFRIMHLDIPIMGIIGRVAFPLFAFVLVYNFLHNTRNPMSYLSRLITLAFISQIPYVIVFNSSSYENSLSIIATLSVGLGLIMYYEKIERIEGIFSINVILHSLVWLSIFCVSGFVVSYMFYGLIMILAFYFYLKDPSAKKLLFLMISILLLNITGNFLNIFFALFSLVIIFGVSKMKYKIPRINKMFFYLFYPVHLLIIAFVTINS